MTDDFEELFQERSEHMKAGIDSVRAEIRSFIDSLRVDDLLVLRNMIGVAAHEESAGFEFVGLITGCLIFKHGLSWDGKSTPWTVQNNPVDPAVEEENQKLEMYNLVYNELGLLRCRNCGLAYSSIDDRMLRPPGNGGCAGCIEKAKWG